MTTEFWCDWYSSYGESAADASGKDWSTWKIIAYGGNGYNYYMAHGGSNFAYFNDDEDAASYDYGAAVGQTGDLRLEYYKFKRAAWFARSFQGILETSDNSTSTYANAATNTAIAVTARQAAAGTILFLANSGTSAQPTKVNINGAAYPQTGSLTVNPSEIMPVVTRYPVIPGVTLNVAPTRILGITQQATTTTMVIYGQAGSSAELYFNVPAGTTISTGAPALNLNGTNLTLQTTYPASGASDFSFQTGSQRVRILAVSDTLADDTWFVDVGTQNYVVCGPQYAGNATVTNGYLQVTTEIPWQNAANNPVTAYGPGDTANFVLGDHHTWRASGRSDADRLADHERNEPSGCRVRYQRLVVEFVGTAANGGGRRCQQLRLVSHHHQCSLRQHLCHFSWERGRRHDSVRGRNGRAGGKHFGKHRSRRP